MKIYILFMKKKKKIKEKKRKTYVFFLKVVSTDQAGNANTTKGKKGRKP